jgi:O-antigen ligase
MESPFTGIGMWNFMHKSKVEFPLHSEYMVHLTEGGLIGFFIWSLFIITVFRGVIKSKQPHYIKIIALFSLVQIMFCGIYARVFYYEFFYPVFGIAIALTGWGIKNK